MSFKISTPPPLFRCTSKLIIRGYLHQFSSDSWFSHIYTPHHKKNLRLDLHETAPTPTSAYHSYQVEESLLGQKVLHTYLTKDYVAVKFNLDNYDGIINPKSIYKM
jgi:hypothetical protein